MTREDAILVLDYARPQTSEADRQFYDDEDLNNALNMAIEALEQEPCKDAMSRQAVFETIDDCNSDGLKGIFCSYDDGERFKEYIKNLPPVTPTRKNTKWVIKGHGFPPEPTTVCAECGFDRDFNIRTVGYDKIKYCPNCGRKFAEIPKVGWSSLENVRNKVEKESEE